MKNSLAADVTVVLFILIMASCVQKDCCVIDESGDYPLVGTWSLFERGYSPGSGYIIEAVDPGQTITFTSSREMTSNIQGLSEFHFYVVQNSVIGFFKEDPGPSPGADTFKTSYDIGLDGETIKLSYRYCVEGCHIRLRRE